MVLTFSPCWRLRCPPRPWFHRPANTISVALEIRRFHGLPSQFGVSGRAAKRCPVGFLRYAEPPLSSLSILVLHPSLMHYNSALTDFPFPAHFYFFIIFLFIRWVRSAKPTMMGLALPLFPLPMSTSPVEGQTASEK